MGGIVKKHSMFFSRNNLRLIGERIINKPTIDILIPEQIITSMFDFISPTFVFHLEENRFSK